ncbi:hypothetical protein [Cytobacillus oceanisediminis]|uniref:hypothetical protein n=1 Tax=Cytobacillus oceanisediminis TaxID=665099 RepID=UPI0003678FF3|nr:hypothetical protein [Cytobacillus oceanisediminis]
MDQEGIQELKKRLITLILDLQKFSQLDLSLLESIIIPDNLEKELIIPKGT